jgi:hypothetical protein
LLIRTRPEPPERVGGGPDDIKMSDCAHVTAGPPRCDFLMPPVMKR